MEYIVTIEEILRREVLIDTTAPEEAVRCVQKLYQDGEIVLGADDFIGEPTITCHETSKNA